MGPAPFTLVLLLFLAWTTHQGLTRPGFQARYLFSVEMIRFHKQYDRLITSAFLHQNWWPHFAMNAITLILFGSLIEQSLGAGYMLCTFLLSALGGSLVVWSLYRKGEYRSLGASGGAFGIVFAATLLFPNEILIFGIIPGWLYALGLMAHTIYCMKTGTLAGVGHEAHFGGALTGILLVLVLAPAQAFRHPVLLVLLLTMGFGGLWYAHANPGRVQGFLRFKFKQHIANHQEKREAMSQGQIDRILDKVSSEGLHSLTEKERRLLHLASKKRGGKR